MDDNPLGGDPALAPRLVAVLAFPLGGSRDFLLLSRLPTVQVRFRKAV